MRSQILLAACTLAATTVTSTAAQAQDATKRVVAPNAPAAPLQINRLDPLVPGQTYRRCGTMTRAQLEAQLLNFDNPPTDCGDNSTNPDPMYSPAALPVIEIPIVWHVISNSMGEGNISDTVIRDQIDILNEDFRARAGTPGANGVDTKIQFRLAEVDPMGMPTTGILRYTNNGWYADSDQTYTTNAWDPMRYCNVYSNQPAGALLGYATFPQDPNAGTAVDRIVVKWETVGRNAPIVGPANQGRTMTHEMGHQLGLYHVFEGSCDTTAGCYNSGDTLCDTNNQDAEYYGCGPRMSCGNADPVTNYMNYTEDACMMDFTEEQARRMRCSIMFYRPMYANVATTGTPYCSNATNSTGRRAFVAQTGNISIASNNLALHAGHVPMNVNGYFITSPDQAFVPMIGGTAGTLCVGLMTGRFNAQVANSGAAGVISLSLDNTRIPRPNGSFSAATAGQTWNFQCWFRDGSGSNMSNGYQVTFQ